MKTRVNDGAEGIKSEVIEGQKNSPSPQLSSLFALHGWYESHITSGLVSNVLEVSMERAALDLHYHFLYIESFGNAVLNGFSLRKPHHLNNIAMKDDHHGNQPRPRLDM
ncbi:unnamed protein product [Gadus morhua 'NCC']